MGLRASISWNIAVTVYWYSRTVVKGLARAAPRGRFQYDSTRRAHEREKGISRRLGAGDSDDGKGPARLPRWERNHEAPHHLSHGPGAGVDVCVRGCGRDASAPGRVQVSADEHAGHAEDVVGYGRRGRACVQEDDRYGPQGGRPRAELDHQVLYSAQADGRRAPPGFPLADAERHDPPPRPVLRLSPDGGREGAVDLRPVQG